MLPATPLAAHPHTDPAPQAAALHTCSWPGEILLALSQSGGTYSVRGS